MSHPNDEHYEGNCGCCLDICGACGKCMNCCDCNECKDCPEDADLYKQGSKDWCSDCERCKEHCVYDDEEEDEDDYSLYYTCTKCGKRVPNRDICGCTKAEDICMKCAGCEGIPCDDCPLDKPPETGTEAGVTVYYKNPKVKPPTEKEE